MLFVKQTKTRMFTLNNVYCSLTGFDIDHSSFIPVCSVHSQGTRFSKKLNFIIEGPEKKIWPKLLQIFGS